MVFTMAGVAAAAAQDGRMSLADGAYTAAQAGRGKVTYDAKSQGVTRPTCRASRIKVPPSVATPF